MDDDFDIQAVVDLEQKFYDAGHADGFAHGRIHGLIEGRALGRQKGFELWEEIGFYEGFAKIWKAVHERDDAIESRASQNTKLLLDLIARFPLVNPSASAAGSPSSPDLDMIKLLNQIRSRYKMLCATVGVKPSLRAGKAEAQSREAGGTVTNDGGDVKGAQSRKTLWKLEGKGQELSF